MYGINLQIDEHKLSSTRVALIVSILIENKVFPLAWSIEQTGGHCHFETQEKLLNRVYDILPENVPLTLKADRFYGTKSLVAWCQDYQFSYRIRIKSNLLFWHEDALLSPKEAFDMGLKSMENTTFNKSTITTNIAILHEQGHPEPWVIAMDCDPNTYKIPPCTADCGTENLLRELRSHPPLSHSLSHPSMGFVNANLNYCKPLQTQTDCSFSKTDKFCH